MSLAATTDLEKAKERIRSARGVLVLTGAGISAESGVPTFRGPEGLWRQFRPEDLATPEAFDGLHAMAGSREVAELHGNLWRVACVACGGRHEDRRVPLPTLPPRCHCGGLLRPDVVWFGEGLPEGEIERAMMAARAADVVLVVGTSSLVYPAAAIAPIARGAGAFIIEVNPKETPLTPLAHASFRSKAAEIVPELVAGHA